MEKSKLSSYILGLIFSSLMLTGCGVPQFNQVKAMDEWRKQQNDIVEKQKKQDEENEAIRAAKRKSEQEAFEKANPEVAVTGIGNVISREKAPAIREALNSMPFETRMPHTIDPSEIYAKVGGQKLTLDRIVISIREQLTKCQRISAYSGRNIDGPCFNQVGKGLSNFSKMIKTKNIPNLTKEIALGQASFGQVINFDHAARLAKMHQELCSKKNEPEYVAMITVAVPCSGRGDVWKLSVAKKIGLL
ncbi:TPA: hypothetical protein ACSTJZ_002319 [Serratia fonticola]